MITLFKEETNKLNIINGAQDSIEKIEPNMWIHIYEPILADVKLISKKTGIPSSFLTCVLDEEESSRIEVIGSNIMIVVDAPYQYTNDKGKESYSTIPFAIIYNQNYFLTICSKKIGFIDYFINNTSKVFPHKHIKMTLQILYRLAENYITYLKKIDYQTKVIEKVLNNSMRNKELFDMMELSKSLVYFSTSLSATKLVISKLTRMTDFKNDSEDLDMIEDLMIEVDQATQMCSVYREILSNMTDAFAAIISNNLNIVMKTLAIFTIVLALPTLVASFYGMNFLKIPLAENPNGFWLIIIFSAFIASCGALLITFLTKRIKR